MADLSDYTNTLDIPTNRDDLAAFLTGAETSAEAALDWLALGQQGHRPTITLSGPQIVVTLLNGTRLITRFDLENFAQDTGTVQVAYSKGPDFPSEDMWAYHVGSYQDTEHYQQLLGDTPAPPPEDLTTMVNGAMGALRRYAIAKARKALLDL